MCGRTAAGAPSSAARSIVTGATCVLRGMFVCSCRKSTSPVSDTDAGGASASAINRIDASCPFQTSAACAAVPPDA